MLYNHCGSDLLYYRHTSTTTRWRWYGRW